MNVDTIFAHALQIKDDPARGRYLDEACAGDLAFRQRVESLLAAHEEAASFLENPAKAILEETLAPEESPPGTPRPPSMYRPIIEGPGTVVGRYKLLQQIGEGGMGVVYMAEQERPVRRRVALKIITPGMDSQQVIARFEAERQALAMMDHPNIARVLDVGCTDTGRPYFVMELVQGIPITKYCDDKQLSTHERLELFIQVCNAIQHAHQKGIIHRDIKPSNVLIAIYDGKPVPKIIDFGVAKALHQRLTEKTMFTQFGAVVGTLEYMSPEQADMDLMGTDTRSDIYSLGVLLYELLTGSTPLDGRKLRSLGYAEMLKNIREVEPPKPSTRLSQSSNEVASISANRHTEPRRLQKLVAGDLDWIVMKCLEKDRTRRYETANGLAMDIQRHLQDEAVAASPPGQFYKLQKLVRRNKLTFSAIAAITLSLVIGLAAALWQANRAQREAARAIRAERDDLAARGQAESNEKRAIEAQASEAAQRALADDNFRQALAAVDDLLRICGQRLRDQPGLQPLRLELMKAAIDRYEPFLAKPIADPTPREELARLHADYGLELDESSNNATALWPSIRAEFEKARTIQEQLLQEHPGDRALRCDLGWTLSLEEWRARDDAPWAERAGLRSIAMFRQLVAEDPADPFARDDLVWATLIYARLQKNSNDPAVSSISDEGLAVGEQLVRDYPASLEFRRDLANALSVNEDRAMKSNPTIAEAEHALSIYRRVLSLRQGVLADLLANRPESFQPQRPTDSEANMVSPSVLYAKCDIGYSSENSAAAYRRLHDWHDLAIAYDQSAAIWKDLVEQNPSMSTFAAALGRRFHSRIDAAKLDNDRRDAALWARDAVQFWQRQMELHRDVPDFPRYYDDAVKDDAEVAQWLAPTASTQATATQAP